MRHLLQIAFLCILPCSLFAQDFRLYNRYTPQELDSVAKIAANLPEGREKLWMFLEMAENAYLNDHERAMKLGFSAIELAEANQFNEENSEAHRMVGWFYSKEGRYSEALLFLLKAEEIIEGQGFLAQHAFNQRSLGMFYSRIKRHELAALHFERSLEFAHASQDRFCLGRICMNYATWLGYKDLDLAEPYYQLALKSLSRKKYPRYHAIVHMTIVSQYFNKNLPERAMRSQQQAYAIHDSIGNENGKAFMILSKATWQMDNGEYEQAQELALSVLRTFESLENNQGRIIAYKSLARNAIEQSEHTLARQYARRCSVIADSLGNKPLQTRCNKRLSDLFRQAKMFEEALFYQLKYQKIQSEILTEEVAKGVSAVELNYLEKLKDREILTAENARDQAETEADRQRELTQYWLLFAVVVFLLSIAILVLYWNVRKAKVVLAQKNAHISADLVLKETLMRELHHRVKNNLQIVDGFFGLQAAKVKADEAQQVIREGRSRLQSMLLLHRSLYNDNNPDTVVLDVYLKNLVDHMSTVFLANRPEVILNAEFDAVVTHVDTAVNLGLIFNELLTNSIKYAFPDKRAGNIQTTVKLIHRKLVLTVKDDGVGFDQKANSNEGFGLTLVQSFSRKLGGAMVLHDGSGTTITVQCPFEQHEPI